jgi:hypothetical protein
VAANPLGALLCFSRKYLFYFKKGKLKPHDEGGEVMAAEIVKKTNEVFLEG